MKIQDMKLLKNCNLKASSLLESVIAIAIISICMLLATMVYVQLLNSDYEIAYYKAKEEVSNLHYKTITEQLFEDEVFQFETFKITKTVAKKYMGLLEVNYLIKTNSKTGIITQLIKPNLLEE